MFARFVRRRPVRVDSSVAVDEADRRCHLRRLVCEPLEDRRLLSVGGMSLASAGDLPDLAIDSDYIAHHPLTPRVGEEAIIDASVFNHGEADATDVLVRFYDDAEFLGEEVLPAIAAGDWAIARVQPLFTTDGVRTITVKVDPLDTIEESDETNNEASVELSVDDNPSWPPDPPALLADLTVEVTADLLHFTDPNVGEYACITAKFLNQGEARATDVMARFYDGEELLSEQVIAGVEVGATEELMAYPQVYADRLPMITVTVDPLDTIEESDESNNEASVQIKVLEDLFGPEQVIISSDSAPRTIDAGDLDGDGDLDTLGAYWRGDMRDDMIVWYENLGEGAFGERHVITTSAPYVSCVRASDLDGDGDVDVLFSSFVDDKIAWYENLGEGTFGQQHIVSLSVDNAQAVHTSDLDGDGDIDILSASEDDDKIAWYENLGAGRFGPQQILTTSADKARSVTASDLDNDGDVDVLSATDTEIAWHENLGDGAFGARQIISSTLILVTKVEGVDLDNDGDNDVVATSSGKVTWYENAGNGVFILQPEIRVGAQGPIASTADLDGDGDVDIVYPYDMHDNATIVWYENVGGGTFATAHAVATSFPNRASHIIPADFDGDGAPDLLAASSLGPLAFYKNLSEGVAHAEVAFSSPQIIEGKLLAPYSVCTVDLDGDGKLDVLYASHFNNKVAWHKGLDDETFGPQRVISILPSEAVAARAADLDGDGDLDVFAATYEEVVWCENFGGGQFGTAQAVTTSRMMASSINAADLDNDGDLDILASSPYKNKVVWFENYGGGAFRFSPQQVITTAAIEVRWAFPSDVDGDGKVDVLTASEGDDTVAWHRNLGDGLFSPRHVITRETARASCVYSADLDLDGDMDVVSASLGDDKIAWYENLGGGEFGSQRVISTEGQLPDFVLAADLDGDGDQDVVATYRADTVAWYENLGDGSFGPHRVITESADSPRFLDIGDLDKDGDLDLFCASLWDNKIAWFENLLITPIPQPPDLLFDPAGLQVFSTSAGVGQVVPVVATVTNQGELDARDVRVRFYDGETLLGERVVASIPGGETETVTIEVSFDTDSYRVITAKVDPLDTVLESNEDNNRACTVLRVGQPTAATGATMVADLEAITAAQGAVVAVTGQAHYDFAELPGEHDFPVAGGQVTVSLIDTQTQETLSIFTGAYTNEDGTFRQVALAPRDVGTYTLVTEVVDSLGSSTFTTTFTVTENVDPPPPIPVPTLPPGVTSDVSLVSQGLTFADAALQAGEETTILGFLQYVGSEGIEDLPVSVKKQSLVAGELQEITIAETVVDCPAAEAGMTYVVVEVPWTPAANGAHIITMAVAPDFVQPTENDAAQRTIVVGTSQESLSILKTFELLVDADSNGRPSPGDTLQVAVAFENVGLSEITNIHIIDEYDSPFLQTPTSASHGGLVLDGTVAWNVSALQTGMGMTATYQVSLKGPDSFPDDMVTVDGRVFAGADQVATVLTTGSIDVDPQMSPLVTSATVAREPNVAGWYNEAVDVTLKSVGGSGAREIIFSIDGGPEVSILGPEATITLADDGIHTIDFYSVDITSVPEATQSITLKTDRTAPSVAHLGPFVVNVGSLLVLDGTGATDGLSGIDTTGWSLHDDALFDDGDPATFLASDEPGFHRVAFKVTDLAGNEVIVESTVTVVSPETTLTYYAESGEVFIDNNAELTTLAFASTAGSFTFAGANFMAADSLEISPDRYRAVAFGSPLADGSLGTILPPGLSLAEVTADLTATEVVPAGAKLTWILGLPNSAPVVALGPDLTISEGEALTLEASFTDPDPFDTHMIEWDFGDGTTSNASPPAPHAYADDGTYTVTLTVTDNRGATSTDMLTVNVENVAPTADAGGPYTIDELEDLSLVASGTDPGDTDRDVLTYAWDFDGDGLFVDAFGTIPNLTWGELTSRGIDDNGEFTIRLRVSDDDTSTETSAQLHVRNLAPTAVVGGDVVGTEGTPVTFDATASYDTSPHPDSRIVQYEWDFGDDTTSGNTSTPNHMYRDNGAYTVTLTVTDNDGVTSSSTSVIEIANASPMVDAGPDQGVGDGELVTFDGSFTDPGLLDSHTIHWDFGDGNTATGTLAPTHTYTGYGSYDVRLTITDSDGAVAGDSMLVNVARRSAMVKAPHIFYNNSSFDGYAPEANVADDNAIAHDKQPLLPGETASFTNYTNYVRGINGIMVDISGAWNEVSASDFVFRVGNDGNPVGWSDAPVPLSVTTRENAGIDGSDRVTIIWADHAIENRWLQVGVLANANTGLTQDEVFYYGNAIGETGNDPSDALVTATDMALTRANRSGLRNRAAIDNSYDFNRDRLVNVTDRLIARSQQAGRVDSLELITLQADAGLLGQTGSEAANLCEQAVLDIDCFLELTAPEPTRNNPTRHAATVDALLADYWP